MHLIAVQRVLGVLLMVFSLSMLPPALMSMIVDDGATIPFLLAFALILVLGVVLWFPVRGRHQDLRTRDGFFVVAMFWIGLSLAGALPFALSENPHMSLTDAVFESASGLTTTGATVIVGIDDLPLSIRYYRQQLQWLGGMGIIVLAVAILPMLGIGGMQLYRAETPGPVKDAKLTPRIGETAKALWYVYLGLTLACAVAFWAAGMTPFDAVGHAFSTLSTGGFSTHDASMGYFDSPLIEMVAVVFMFLGGVNFALHFMAWRRRSTHPYVADSEFRFYVGTLVIATIAIIVMLVAASFYDEPGESLHHAIFQVTSFATTTGFTTAAFYDWPTFVPMLLIFLGMLGASASSTSGGIKMVRFLLLFKQGSREIMRLIHPQAQILVKLGDKQVSERVIDSVWGFFSTYIAVYAIMMLVLMALGSEPLTAFTAVAATISNLGPGLGDVAVHFGNVDAGGKWVLSLAMIMGRLEIFTLLVLITPAFWRR